MMIMKKYTNYLILFILLILSGEAALAKNKVISPSGRFDTRFLIIIDQSSYDAVKQEVLDYQKVLVEEGLGAVIVVGDWERPDQLKEDLQKLYKKKPVIEGVVFVGDIPVARIRNFQHATTAFKMNETEFPIEESSVTSDRYYDDLDLEFEFISADDKNENHFYYNLKESSPQVIKSEFYSARMLPPSDVDLSQHELLKRYLIKVVEAHKEVNYADNIKIFNGHGYNFDCLTVWQNQQFAIKEQFPEAFKSSLGNAFYNFRQRPFMKYDIFERLQRKNTDVFVFHEHGAFDTQYISGPYIAPNVLGYNSGAIGPMEAFSISLRNGYRHYSGEKAEKYKANVTRDYGLDPTFFDDDLMELTRVSDSTFAANENIVLEEIWAISPQPRITIFDACYNGSFHKPGYVAGYHVFNDGNTVVAQGNTVNVLQDKWSMELVGMLAEGARIGFWQKEIQTLESHLIGDPTYRLIPGSRTENRSFEALALNKNLALHSHKNKIWLRYLESDNPNYQAIALKQLSKNPPKDYEDLLMKYLKESPYYSVRMQALQRIIYGGSKKLPEALIIALNDPYELIRRNAARFSGYCGDIRLIEPLVENILFANESQRVQYSTQSSLEMFDLDLVVDQIMKSASNSYLLNGDKTASDISGYYEAQKERQQNRLDVIMDKDASAEERIFGVRNLRNYNNHKQVEDLLLVLSDNSDDTQVRIVLAEALGWFRWSIKRPELLKTLHEIYKDKSLPNELRSEVHQSILRLKYF